MKSSNRPNETSNSPYKTHAVILGTGGLLLASTLLCGKVQDVLSDKSTTEQIDTPKTTAQSKPKTKIKHPDRSDEAISGMDPGIAASNLYAQDILEDLITDCVRTRIPDLNCIQMLVESEDKQNNGYLCYSKENSSSVLLQSEWRYDESNNDAISHFSLSTDWNGDDEIYRTDEYQDGYSNINNTKSVLQDTCEQMNGILLSNSINPEDISGLESARNKWIAKTYDSLDLINYGEEPIEIISDESSELHVGSMSRYYFHDFSVHISPTLSQDCSDGSSFCFVPHLDGMSINETFENKSDLSTLLLDAREDLYDYLDIEEELMYK